eukprot:2922103-Prymnesium_polylepis.1
MATDGAVMLYTARRPKTLFIHACLHALMVRGVVMIDGGQTVPRFERASGVWVDGAFLERFRIWGAD